MSSSTDVPPPPSFLSALVAGGMAGTCVDVALFPIDTIKTRLQSPQGFLKAGGFTGVYQGLGAAAAGSAPGAALFFSVYEVS
jgi:solute carrier family 25 S-adenosylmethionine transporter 26